MSVKLRTVFGVIVAFTFPCVASTVASAQPTEGKVSEPLWATLSHPAAEQRLRAATSAKLSTRHAHIAQLAPTVAPMLHGDEPAAPCPSKHQAKAKISTASTEEQSESSETEESEHKSSARHGSSKQFTGVADYYADMFHGRRTASGQVHDKRKFTAAHRSLPFGTHLRITNKRSGKSCVVVVNDRGPFTQNRIIDLSYAAAKEIGLLGGRRDVECAVVDEQENEPVID